MSAYFQKVLRYPYVVSMERCSLYTHVFSKFELISLKCPDVIGNERKENFIFENISKKANTLEM